MTTYWDPKATRAVAAADAETRLAQAEATRAETMLRIEAQRAEQAEKQRRERHEAQVQARRERLQLKQQAQVERIKRRKARGQARRQAFHAVAGAVSARVPLLVGVIAMGAPIAIAWDGQLEFGEQIMRLGALAFTVPVALEGSAWYLAWLTHTALEAARPTGRLRAWTWLLALTAAGMNVWHGVTGTAFGDDGLQVGLVRGLASLLGVGLWELTVMARRQRNSGRSLSELRTALWRRVRYPRLSWQAASIAAARGVAYCPDEAWRAAWIDRYGVGPEACRRERRLARQIMRRQAKADRKAIKAGQVAMVGGLMIGRPVPPVMPVDRFPLTPVHRVATPAASIDDPIEPKRIDPPKRRSIEAAPKPIESKRIDAKPAVDRRKRRSIQLPVAGDGPAPRRSIEEHRQILHELIGQARISSQPTAEEIRTTLRCAPKTAATLREELVRGVAA